MAHYSPLERKQVPLTNAGATGTVSLSFLTPITMSHTPCSFCLPLSLLLLVFQRQGGPAEPYQQR